MDRYTHCENDMLCSADTLMWDANQAGVPIESIWMEYQENTIILSMVESLRKAYDS